MVKIVLTVIGATVVGECRRAEVEAKLDALHLQILETVSKCSIGGPATLGTPLAPATLRENLLSRAPKE
jgi:hypothetical protein